MTTRIGTGGPSTGVSASSSAARVTDPPAQPFKAIMNAGAGAILSGAEQAMTRLPGGPILAAALRPSAGDASTGAGVTPTGAGATGSMGSLTPEGTAGTAGIGSGAAGSGSPAGSGAEDALTQTANENLYFIELQQRISNETNKYSAWSNVLKAQHDTMKNAIGNIR